MIVSFYFLQLGPYEICYIFPIFHCVFSPKNSFLCMISKFCLNCLIQFVSAKKYKIINNKSSLINLIYFQNIFIKYYSIILQKWGPMKCSILFFYFFCAKFHFIFPKWSVVFFYILCFVIHI